MLKFIIVSLFVLGLHNVVIYAMRRKDRSPLYFGLFCILLSINTWASSSEFPLIFKSLSHQIIRKMDMITIVSAIPVFIMFIQSFYQEEKNVFVNYVVSVITMVFIILFFFLNAGSLELTFKLYYPVIIFCTVFSLYVVVRALQHHRSDARPVLFGVIILSFAGINDILWGLNVLNTVILMPVATFLFAFLYSVLLSKRFAIAFAGTERLAVELQENQRLRDEVERKIKEENHLRQTQHLLTGLLHAIKEPLCAINENRTIEFCNRAFEELAGISFDKLTGSNVDYLISNIVKEYSMSEVPLELDDDELSVLIFKSSENGNSQGVSAIAFIEELNKNRARIRSLESVLTNANPEIIKTNDQLNEDLKLIDSALEQMGELLSNNSDFEKKKVLGSTVVALAIQYWIECTGKSKADFARESSLWAVHTNPDGWDRTQTLDKYLSARTFPKLPRWPKIIKTADYVLVRCTNKTPIRTELELSLQQLILLV